MARKTTGTLRRRGKVWWVRAQVNGAVLEFSTGETDRRKAAKVRDERLAHVTVGGAAAKARALAQRAAGLEAEARALELAEVARMAAADRLPVSGAWELFLASKKRREAADSTMVDYRARWAHFEGWARDSAGIEHLEDIGPEQAEAFAAWLERQDLSPNRRRKTLQFCRRMFAMLAPRLNGRPNPFAEVSDPVGLSHHRRPLSEGELREVCGAATGELRTLLAVGLYSGVRLGDACTLSWESIDLLVGQIAVVPRKTASRSGKTVIVPLHPVLAKILAETPPEGRRGPVLPETCARYLRSNSQVCRDLRRHFERCGIGDTSAADGTGTARPNVGFHSLRYSFVTLCRAAGAGEALVQAIVGHGSPAMTRAYTRIGPDAVAPAVRALPDVTAPLDPDATRRQAAKEAAIAAIRADDFQTARRLLDELED